MESPDAMLPVRLAARVILLDPDDRVLLMRYHDTLDGRHWSTPGRPGPRRELPCCRAPRAGRGNRLD
ncbi:MAG: hypothetical protein ACRDNZ_03025 [Streptosporangiaceae bacterium]